MKEVELPNCSKLVIDCQQKVTAGIVISVENRSYTCGLTARVSQQAGVQPTDVRAWGPSGSCLIALRGSAHGCAGLGLWPIRELRHALVRPTDVRAWGAAGVVGMLRTGSAHGCAGLGVDVHTLLTF